MSKKGFKVVWTHSAAKDLQEIASYAKDLPSDARKVLDRLKEKGSTLTRFHNRGRVVPELAFFGIHTYRELIVRPYRMVYRISGDTVIVLAVLDSRRDLEDVLLERLVRGE